MPATGAQDQVAGTSPADGLKRSAISPALLNAIGGGDAGKNFVAVLGDVDPSIGAKVMRTGLTFADADTIRISRCDGGARSIKIADGSTSAGKAPSPVGVRFAVASPTGHRIVYQVGNDVSLWDTVAGKVIAPLPKAVLAFQVGAFSPDGKLFLTAGLDDHVYLFDTADGKKLATLPYKGFARVVAFSSNGATAAVSTDEDAFIRLIDVTGRKWKEPLPLPKGEAEGPLALTISRDGQKLAAGRANVFVYDLAERSAPRKMGVVYGLAYTLAFNADASLLAATSEFGGQLFVWETASGVEKVSLAGIGGYTTVAAFAPTGNTLAVAGEYQPVTLLNGQTGETIGGVGIKNEPAGPVYATSVSPDGKMLAVASGPTVRVWSLATGAQLYFLKHTTLVLGLAFSADSSRLATADCRNLRMWTATEGKPLWHQPNELNRPGTLVFHGNDAVIGSAADGSATVWDAAAGNPLRSWAKEDRVHAVAISPDGTMVATGGQSGDVRLFDLAVRGDPIRSWHVPSEVMGLAFRPDGKELAATTRVTKETDRTSIFRFDLIENKPLPPVPASLHAADSPTYRADNKALAAGAFDGILRVWGLPDAGIGYTYSNPLFPNGLRGANWTPDGRHLIVGTPFGAALVFRLASEIR
ncbi:MAG TPA: WD40 repeat domain-containing protein [Gemmataceae bacterium]|nr:WD40 repeat domain-containing protein [Gemmataceae bacterium]